MAEGLMRHLSGGRVNATSAGSSPASRVSPAAVEVMKELGIDISNHMPKSLRSVADQDFDWVITLCDSARQSCPVFSGAGGHAKQLHWSIPDPHESADDTEELLKNYRKVRDDLALRIRDWLDSELGST
jgi:arsenate reductase